MLDPATETRLTHGKGLIKERFWTHSNITSVGVGARQRGGEWTDEPAVTVGVVKKRRPGYLRADEILPDRIDVDGISHKVDVVETGVVRFCGQQEFPGAGNDPKKKWMLAVQTRPLQAGAAIVDLTTRHTADGGGIEYYGGTIAAFVKDAQGVVHALSNAHVMVNLDRLHQAEPVIGDKMTQPFPDSDNEAASVVGELSGYVPYLTGIFAKNTMDCAIARLYDQSGWTTSYPGNRMSPNSPQNKAIGLFFASNSDHSRCFIVRLEPMLQRLGVSMVVADSTFDVSGYQMFEPIEKVGARTGYSSTQIVNVMDSTKVHMDDGRYYSFDNLIATERMGWPGDSGSLVRLGGDGITPVILENVPDSGCGVFDSVGNMYALPLNGDIPLADNIRDNFLAQTRLGSLLTHLFYLNAETVTNRSIESPASDYEKAGARGLYDKYRNYVASAMANPRDPAYVVTQQHLDDTASAINGAALHMTQQETDALKSIYNTVITPTLGMHYDQVLTHMNNDTVYHSVLDTLTKVPTIVTEGVVGPG
ncbi:hypothetical protein [Amycolatopsis sp. NPDC021455]|uniref:hypothetical protein n=1 Tax=Amycolatopsis sp. NPDC021455 TaxID=3154901 RepID=UPI0033FB65D7